MLRLKPFDPPFLLNKEHSFIDDKIKSFSTNLFINKIFGCLTALLFNIYLIHCFFKNKNLLTIILELLLLFLIQYTIAVNLFNSKRK